MEGPRRQESLSRPNRPPFPAPLAAGAMLRCRCRIILAQVLSPRSASPVSQLRRLVSAATSRSPPGFAVEDYLVATCGLTRAQARKASAKLSHLRTPSNPDAVLAFLAGLGLSGADVAALVAKDPVFLCARVDRTLAPVVAGLTGAGLSHPEIARLVSITSVQFRCRSVVSGVEYYLRLLGSSEDLFRALRRGSCLLSADLERVVKPNAAFLQECGLGACDIARLCCAVPWMLSANPERVRAMAACAEGVGVPRGSKMFRHALQAVAFLSEEKIAAKVDYLKKTFGWSDAEVGIAASKAPFVLRKSMESLQKRSEFLISEVGLEPAYIAPRSMMLNYSLEGWLRPRYYVLKFLKANGLLEFSPSYFTTVRMTKNVFEERFICPYKEAAPHLAEDYEAACTGKCRLISNFHEPVTDYDNWKTAYGAAKFSLCVVSWQFQCLIR